MSSAASRTRATLLGCIGLGLVVLVGTALQGPPRYTGLRWVPSWSLPSPTPAVASIPPRSPHSAGSPQSPPVTLDLSPVVWLLVALAVVAAAILAWRLWKHRAAHTALALQATTTPTEPTEAAEQAEEVEPDAATVHRGLVRALELLDEDREPGDAIVVAWLGLQESAEDSGIRRRASETPTEFTTRILSRLPADADAATTLLRLYLRARFGDQPSTAADVSRARHALATLAGSWLSGQRL